MIAVLVAVGGGVGAVLRFLVDGLVTRCGRGRLGVPVVNVTGSFVLGLVVGWFGAGELGAVLGTGLLGGYTTFSAASLDAVRLVRDERRPAAVGHAVGMLVLGLGAAALGLWLAG
ncbi:fluoride efflux transporter FluC [Georgenia sunbinii]|uniref:fluoride efflux transporter FluC n=1 Tax=Georgenia sunbinii TaxID=3117728 RepID=UPI002F26991E